MTNTEKLLTTKKKADLVLYAFIIACGVSTIVNEGAFNRGDMFETCLTHAPKKYCAQKISQGDMVLNGVIYEIKYVSKSTFASAQTNGSVTDNYIIAFNTNKEIIIKAFKESELTYKMTTPSKTHPSKPVITYKNNIENGKVLKVFTL